MIALAAQRFLWPMLVWGGVLIVLLMVFLPLSIWLKRKLMSDTDSPKAAITMETLEHLRSSGKIDQNEFAALRRAIFGLDDNGKAKNASQLSPDGQVDDVCKQQQEKKPG